MPLRPLCLSAGSSGHSRTITTFASRKLLHTQKIAHRSKSEYVILTKATIYACTSCRIAHDGCPPTYGARTLRKGIIQQGLRFPAIPVVSAEEQSGVGTRTQAERRLHADFGRAKPAGLKPSPRTMRSIHARRGRKRNGPHPRGTELPSRLRGTGCFTGPPTGSTAVLKPQGRRTTVRGGRG